jgi:hypothetical protein
VHLRQILVQAESHGRSMCSGSAAKSEMSA